jgi:hypothetical protein
MSSTEREAERDRASSTEREAERDRASSTVGPIDASKTPRFAGPASFARLPRLDQVPRADIVVAGVPFDSGVSYRPGARFGPTYVRRRRGCCARTTRRWTCHRSRSPRSPTQAISR